MKKLCNYYCDNINPQRSGHGNNPCYHTYRGGGCPGFIIRPEKEEEYKKNEDN